MADSYTANLNLRKPEVGFAEDTWGGVAGLNGDLDILDSIFAPLGTGTSVGLNIGTGKALRVYDGTLVAADQRLLIHDGGDPTRAARFSCALIPPGTGALYTFPAVSDTLVGLTQAQQLTNKTTPDPPAADNTQKLVNAHWVNAAISAAVTAAIAAYQPFAPGCVMAYAGNSAPAGWLNCNGSAVSRATYAALFAIIGTTYGAGDGSTTFNLPATQGRTIVAPGTGVTSRANLGALWGSEYVTLTAAQMPSHTHNAFQSNDAVQGGGGGNFYVNNTHVATATTGAGADAPHENCQPSICLYYIIKY
jgi:microcystin-dependent protein